MSDLIKEGRQYISALAPHIKERRAAELIIQLVQQNEQLQKDRAALEKVVEAEANWQMERYGLVSQRLTNAINNLKESKPNSIGEDDER